MTPCADMKTRITACILLALLSVPSMGLSADENSHAADKFRGSYKRIFGGAIAECAEVVRKEIRGSGFDAYYKDAATIAIYGSPREEFAFEKCMQERGYPVGAKWYETR
jgi:hypothetical protein